MDKSIKEMANELDINPLRIYRFIAKDNIEPIKTIKGTKMFDESAQSLIKKHFNLEYKTGWHKQTKIDDNLMTILQNELQQKNQQIERLQSTLENQQRLLDQQQRLSLNDQNLITDKDNTIKELSEIVNKNKNKKWFQFWK